MLGRDFIRVGGVKIPSPASFSISYDNIEDINQSEAGTDRTIVTRLQKKEVTITFTVTDFWKEKLLAFGRENQTTFQIGSETAMTGRFRVTGTPMILPSNLDVTTIWQLTAKFYQI